MRSINHQGSNHTNASFNESMRVTGIIERKMTGFVTIDIKVEVFVPEPPFYNLCFLKFIQIKDVWLIQLGFHNYFILKRYRFLTIFYL